MKATAALMLVLSFALMAQSCAQLVRTDAVSSFIAECRALLAARDAR